MKKVNWNNAKNDWLKKERGVSFEVVKQYYDAEEKELIESIEKGEWKSVKNLEKEKKRYSKIFKASSAKSEQITIKITPKDLRDIKIQAEIEGLNYKALISSILHKYLTGKLIEKSA